LAGEIAAVLYFQRLRVLAAEHELALPDMSFPSLIFLFE
jgi:hypothetical protein